MIATPCQSPRAKRTSTRRAPARTMSSARRDALLAQHVGLVHHVARQLARRLSTAAELDELVSAGAVGLVQAVDSFDAERGLSFSTYAVPRIRGAILDELRRLDHLSRNVRRRSRVVARARDELVGTLRRPPTDAEVSRHLAIPTNTLHRWEADADGATLVSLEQPVRSEIGGATLGDTITDERGAGIEDLLCREQEVAQLKAALGLLKEQERTVLALNYFEELKLQEIADVLDLSVCRISQIRTAALAKLRVALNDLRAA